MSPEKQPYKYPGLTVIGATLGMVTTDLLHVFATENYRFYFLAIFITLLFLNAFIVWGDNATRN